MVALSEGEPAPPAPPPRIDPKTPLTDLMICTRGVLTSVAGAVWEGTIVRKDDARVTAVPEEFRPLIEQL